MTSLPRTNSRFRTSKLCNNGHLVTVENSYHHIRNGRTYFTCRECSRIRERITDADPDVRRKRRESNKRTQRKYQREYRDKIYRSIFGISLDERDAMLAAQGGKCANLNCTNTSPGGRGGWHTDHDHITGQIRGLLCVGCNLVLGYVKDNRDRLHGLIAYLESHSSKVNEVDSTARTGNAAVYPRGDAC